MTEHYEIIQNISMVVWVVSAIRQFKSRFFHYFLILALADPISVFVLQWTFGLYTNGFFVLVSFLLLAAVLNAVKREKMGLLLTFLSMIILSPTLLFNITFTSFAIVVFNFAILLIFLREAVVNWYLDREFNGFIWMLVFYSITICAKFLPMVIKAGGYIEFYAITGIFQVLIGFFFTIYTENSPAMKIKLKTHPVINTKRD